MIKRYAYFFFWTIGFILILYLASQSLEYFNTKSDETFNASYEFWPWGIANIIIGIYFSLYRGIPKKIIFNSSQLVILILSFIFTAYPFLIFYLGLPNLLGIDIVMVYNNESSILIPVLFGFSIVNTFFGFKTD
ncbi:hypothetical protein D3C87_451630 [compost metagenome]